MRFLAPQLVSLMLAVFLRGTMVRGALLRPELLMGGARSGIESVSGAVVLVSLFAASAQVLNTLTPESGLLHLLFNLFFAGLFWTTLAAAPDRPRLLRSLLVVFGWALLAKYVVLAALYEPQGGLARRLVRALLEGVSLGALEHEPLAPATGYAAFFTVLLYVTGLVLLPSRGRGSTALEPSVSRTAIAEVEDV
jgi:hypothetical protein